MFEKVSVCPICESTEFTNTIICQDSLVSQESFVLTDCKNCGFRITNPRPDSSSLPRYYQSQEYNPHAQTSSGFFSILYRFARRINFNWKFKVISNLQQSGSLLDFGCGTGEFAAHMKSRGWDVTAIEPDKKSRDFGINEYNLKILENLTYIPDNQLFNVITLWHVLEHVPDINSLIEQLASHLTKTGMLLIAVPNHQSYDADYYGQNWAGYDVPRHLYHFTQKSMKQFLKRNKLLVDQIIPMKLDSYYVSILSERNKKDKAPLLRGVLTGYRSNSEAAKNKNNYSSLLYVVKK